MFGSLLGDRLVHHPLNVGIALIGNNGFGIVVQFPFAVYDVLFNMGKQIAVQTHFLADQLIPLEELDGIPAQVVGRDLSLDGFLNVGQGMLHTAVIHMGDFMVGVVSGQGNCLLRGFHTALTLQGADLHTGAAQGPAQLFQINGVTVLPDQVDHVHGHHHGMAQFDQLGGQVQVPFDVGAVHDVQNGIGMLLHQILPGHQLLGRIGRQGVDAGKVLDDDIGFSLQRTLLLFHRDTGPVAHILVGTGQDIEQCRFAAVGITCKGNFDTHICTLLL